MTMQRAAAPHSSASNCMTMGTFATPFVKVGLIFIPV